MTIRKLSKTLSLSLMLLLAYTISCRKPTNPPDNGDSTKYEACISGGSTSTFEITTFNIENFLLAGFQTVAEIATLIEAMDADIIAFQEVASKADFKRLDDLLTRYTAIEYPIDNDDWNLAYLYKTADITLDESETKIIFEDDFSAFPRPPFLIDVTHKPTGISAVIINNHLKCCGGYDNEERRRSASSQLHSFVEAEYPARRVLILDDLNDEIDGTTEQTNVFWDFVNDTENYMVADLEIAKGSPLWWSYPSWPSHIDHIIISDELVPDLDTTIVIKADPCFSDYPSLISDHRPVSVILK